MPLLPKLLCLFLWIATITFHPTSGLKCYSCKIQIGVTDACSQKSNWTQETCHYGEQEVCEAREVTVLGGGFTTLIKTRGCAFAIYTGDKCSDTTVEAKKSDDATTQNVNETRCQCKSGDLCNSEERCIFDEQRCKTQEEWKTIEENEKKEAKEKKREGGQRVQRKAKAVAETI